LPHSTSRSERSRVGTDEYLGHIDGMIFGVNPRHGFFEDHRFKHPDMAFQLDFPRDWRTQNLAQMVVAGSPDQDAVIQLDLAEGAPDAAARQFFGSKDSLAATSHAVQSMDSMPW
jgi:predicted Zn-dependent protease